MAMVGKHMAASGTVVSGATRVYGIMGVNVANATGSLKLRDGGAAGTVRFEFQASAISGGIPFYLNFREPIPFTTDVYAELTATAAGPITVLHDNG